MKDFERLFSDTVRDINTKSSNWKKDCIGKISRVLTNYLNNEIVYNKIIDFELNIERKGQSLITCEVRYIENFCSESNKMLLTQRVRTPYEIDGIMWKTLGNAYFMKGKRENVI